MITLPEGDALWESCTPVRLVKSLASTVCPACGGWKKPRMSLCSRDYRSLSKDCQLALYRRVGSGYEQALVAALRQLHTARPIWASDPKQKPEADPQQELAFIRHVSLDRITFWLLAHSLRDVVCPKCAGAKPGGRALCDVCVSAVNAAGQRAAGALLHLTAATLEVNPNLYSVTMVEALRAVKTRVFCHTKEPQP